MSKYIEINRKVTYIAEYDNIVGIGNTETEALERLKDHVDIEAHLKKDLYDIEEDNNDFMAQYVLTKVICKEK